MKIHDVKIDQEYMQWLSEIKARYRNAQIKVAVKVNAEQMLFNWQLGRDLVMRKAEERWGAGVVEQISLDLQAEFPESKGFSTTNLWYMKQWYRFYADNGQKLHQLGGELQAADNQMAKKIHQIGEEIAENGKPNLAGADFPALLALIPWRHHVEIVSKCKNIDEALFYKDMRKKNWRLNSKGNSHASFWNLVPDSLTLEGKSRLS